LYLSYKEIERDSKLGNYMRYIKPEIIVNKRFGKNNKPQFDIAIFIFRDKKASNIIKTELGSEPFYIKLLWGIPEENTNVLSMKGKKVLIIEQLLWGGPQAAILIEELSQFEIKKVIGIGACGSLDKNIHKNDIVIDVQANCTDGTSKYYTKEKSIKPTQKIIGEMKKYGLKEAISSTIDAIYQETEENINIFKINSSTIVNMESAPFYASAKYCDLEAVWIGCVSDTLYENEWEDWFDSEKGTKESARIVKRYLEENYY
jgi:purine-nucleoside phosphorylase